MRPNPNYASDSLYGLMRTNLYQNGLFDDDADAVLKRVVARDDSMRGRWKDNAAGYPRPLLTALLMTVHAEAVAWIDENAPMHWARDSFAVPETEESADQSRSAP